MTTTTPTLSWTKCCDEWDESVAPHYFATDKQKTHLRNLVMSCIQITCTSHEEINDQVILEWMQLESKCHNSSTHQNLNTLSVPNQWNHLTLSQVSAWIVYASLRAPLSRAQTRQVINMVQNAFHGSLHAWADYAHAAFCMHSKYPTSWWTPIDTLCDVRYGHYNLVRQRLPSVDVANKARRFHLVRHVTILRAQSEWEYGVQKTLHNRYGDMYYLAFYDMLVSDHDGDGQPDTQTRLLAQVKQRMSRFLPDDTFAIYETCRGYHCMLVSRFLSHRSPEMIQVMGHLNSDAHYTLFCYRYGYCVRLSRKAHRSVQEEPFVARYMGLVRGGNDDLPIRETDVTPECRQLLHIYDAYLLVHHK